MRVNATVQTTLRSGRGAGIAVGAGLGSMAATWTLLAAGGLARSVVERYMRARLCIDRTAASILGALGLWIAVSALA